MKLAYVATGAVVALFPMASFALIAVEVIMVCQIAKKYDAINVADLAWFCSRMIVISLVLKFLAAWLHFIPGLGQIANSLVAAGFIFFAYEIADAHYRKRSSE